MAGGEERILRRRIHSIEATKKLTRAFELIAASQIVRSQGRIARSRPYVQGMRKALATAAVEQHGTTRLLGSPAQGGRALLVVIAGDRGLCGGYNSLALRMAERQLVSGEAQGRSYRVVTVGRKSEAYFRYRRRSFAGSFTKMSDRPAFADAREVAAAVVGPFLAGDVDLVEIVSWRFRSAGSQLLEARQLLPLPGDDVDAAPGTLGGSEAATAGFYGFEPEPAELLELLVPVYAEAELFVALLEASASEHTARQRAMAAATENAEDLITTLRRQMNRVRQEAITTEIMEIVGGAEALREVGDEHDHGLVDLDLVRTRERTI